MYKIVGILVDCHGEEIETVAATFDTEKQARDYIKKSKLKKPKRYQSYRWSSLLGAYDYAIVCEMGQAPIPHNPIL